jgi:succinylglutamate desuccinylase
MREGYKNFQAIKAGEVLADDKNGEIVAPEDCLLLMPLYQRQGTDGFFLVKGKMFD